MVQPNTIIIFDNSCILCNTAVRFIFKFSKIDNLYFTHFESDYFKSHLASKYNFEQVDSIILIENHSVFYKSEAIIKILKLLKNPLNLLVFARFLPIKFRDFCYDLVAENRYKIFGKTKSCIYDKNLADKILN